MKLYGLNINKKFSHERMNIKAIPSKDESKQLIKKKTVNDLLSLYMLNVFTKVSFKSSKQIVCLVSDTVLLSLC